MVVARSGLRVGGWVPHHWWVAGFVVVGGQMGSLPSVLMAGWVCVGGFFNVNSWGWLWVCL